MKLFRHNPYFLLDNNIYYSNISKKCKFSKVVYIFFILSYYLYYLALEKCMKGQYLCGKNFRWIHKKLAQAILSALIIAIMIELMILRLVTKLHLIHVFISLACFFIYSHDQEFYDHGLFNFLGHILIVIISLALIFPFNILIYIIKNKNKILIFIYLTFLIFLFFFFLYFVHSNLGCKDWPKGLNNTYIENNIKEYGCKIKTPKFCPYRIGTYFLDITKIYNIKCKRSLSTKTRILKFSKSPNINKNTKKFGYPLTNKDPLYLNIQTKTRNIYIYVKKNLIDMDNKKQLNKTKLNIPEVVADFSKNPYGEIIINVNYNKTLSKERKKLEKKSNPYYENILMLFFDSVSRSNGLRQLKKTFKFIEKFMPYKGYSNKLDPNDKYHAFQFMKYHSFKYNTRGNYPKMFYGHYKGKIKFRITKYLKQNGFVTALTNDLCRLDSCYLPHNMSLEEISDHEFLICDPNKRSTNIMIKRCLYNKINVEYQLEYGNQFWRKYKNNRKFLLIINNDGHEGTLEILKYDDEYVFQFLNNLFNENLLKDTIVMLLSDHGSTMPSIYYFNNFHIYEEVFPMLYVLSYDKKNLTYNEQYKYIHQNQQKLITALDIYNTIGYLAYGSIYKKIKDKEKSYEDTPKTKFGKSIFTKIDSKRKPSDYKGMKEDICLSTHF
jgi:hypothetical protein